ncbi:MAG TPA: hypothetical protein VMD59_18065, partial [Acidimicrobiales bacterium]|nr:hypothetical protein [Acidimicrobiales bacterium]
MLPDTARPYRNGTVSTPGTHPDGASAAGAEPAGAEPAGAEAAPGAEALEPPSPGPRQLPVASVLLTSRPRVRPGGSRLTISDSPQAPERSATAVRLAALLATVTGLALAAYGLTLPHALLGVHDYDDGVYFGAALRLVDGVAPYRDFVLPHPPGIALLLAPIALLGRAIGSDDALAVARCLTVLVAGLNCGLVALALRHRGPIASLAGGLALACFPYAVTADQTVLLEPYLAFACLLGTVLAFPEGELATGRRAVLAGVVFGLAGCIKIWAAFPVIALLLVTAPRWRQSGTRLLAGVVAGFAVPCLPFAALAPGTFFHDIVVDQVLRGAGSAGYGIATRLGELSGISALASHLHPSGLVPIATVLAVLAGWSYLLLGRRARACDWFLLLAAVISLAAVLLAREFYEYYTYFPAVFVAGVVGVCAGRWGELLGALVGRLRTSSPLSPPEPPTPAGGTDSPRPASGGEGGGSAPRWPA